MVCYGISGVVNSGFDFRQRNFSSISQGSTVVFGSQGHIIMKFQWTELIVNNFEH